MEDYVIVQPSLNDLHGHLIDINNLPKVSFCIPTLNNEETLERCLQSIKEQDYPDIEIIIVDGYSKDKTINIAKKYTDKIYFDNSTLGSARQMSIEKSRGEILAIFDSDIIIPNSKWLINAIKYFNYDDCVSTVWPMNVAPPGGRLTSRLYFNHWKIIIDNRIKKKRGLVGGGNALFYRKYFAEISGVNRLLHWGEDFDWAQKLKNKGYKVIYIKNPLYHDTMRTFRQFAKKQFIGANTFNQTGFQIMDLSISEIFNEQVILGSIGMIKGLIIDRDISWLLFPIFLAIKSFAYLTNYLNMKVFYLAKISN